MKLLISLLALFLVTGCSELCGNDPLHGEESPDKTKLAIAFVRSCGATTGFSSHVSVIDRNGSLPNKPGNILIVDGKQPISVKWLNNSTLEVDLPIETKTYKKIDKLGEISIKYKGNT